MSTDAELIADVRAKLIARAKLMVRLRESFINMRDDLEDEGDRVYFGSSNDADAFRSAVEELDDWAWDDIIADAQQRDYIGENRDLRAEVARLATALEAARAEEREACARACEGEHLEEPSMSDGDIAYDQAIADCARAIRNRTPSPPAEEKKT